MVPVDKKIRIITTANDVVHSWYVPAFGVKQDAIPGFVRDTWFKAEKTGTFRGFCTELCGKEHAYMPVVVEVLSADDYTAWVDGQKKKMAASADDPNKTYTMDELKARGAQVYTSNCAVCHQPTGKGAGQFPALDGSKIANGPIADHVSIVLKGKGAMPNWGATLNDVEIASVITYERNTWGNHTGDILQPLQVADARNGKMPAGGDHLAGAGAAAASDAAARRRRRAVLTQRVRLRRHLLRRLRLGRFGSGGFAAGERLFRDGQECFARRRRQRRPGCSRLREGASGRKADAVGFHRRNRLRREERRTGEDARAGRSRRAEGCGRSGRPHHFEEAGNDHGRC